MDIVLAATKTMVLTLLVSSIPIAFFLLGLFWWIRRFTKGKVLIIIIGEDKFTESYLVPFTSGGGRQTVSIGGGKKAKEGDYELDKDNGIFTLWPEGPGVPEFIRYPIATFYFNREASSPIIFGAGDAKSKAMSASTRRQVNDDKFLGQLIAVARDELRGSFSASGLLKYLLIGIAVALGVLILASGAILYFLIQNSVRIEEVAAVLGVQ